MAEQTKDTAKKLSLQAVIDKLDRISRLELMRGYDLSKFLQIFEDDEMMEAIECYFDCGMNITRCAKMKFMHRNTMIYRLNRIKDYTGLDLTNFQSAVTFQLLYLLYRTK